MPVKLTKSTFEALRREIPQNSLPLTFRHALELTRRLNKRYLWIDSLCIFQDDNDKSDWLKEAAYMDKVYSNTFLNISATGAEDSSQGLFAYRDGKLAVLPTTFSCPASSGWVPASRDLVVVDDALLHVEVNNAPLNQRGWVLQERWLSPRILHFGTGQVFWECRQKFLCERFPVELPGVLDRAHDLKRFDIQSRYSLSHAMRNGGTARSDIRSLETRDKMWRQIMIQYSKTRLSFSEDRLIALSGIAKVLQDTFDDQYVAGLWRHNLEHQIAWSATYSKGADFRRRQIYVAPTWSWLSVDGPVAPTLLDPTYQIYIDVLHVSLEYESEDTTGSITGGFLILKGHLRPLDLFSKDDGKADVTLKGQHQGWRVRLDEAIYNGPSVQDHSRESILHGFGIVIGTTKRASDPIIDVPSDQTRMFISHQMLLLRCIDRCNGIFERIGLAVLPEEDDTFWEALQLNSANNADIPCVQYDRAQQVHTVIVK